MPVRAVVSGVLAARSKEWVPCWRYQEGGRVRVAASILARRVVNLGEDMETASVLEALFEVLRAVS